MKLTKAKIDVWRIICIGYSLFMLYLNSYRIFDNNFWGDECFTIRLAKMSFMDMFKATAADVHPPLFYCLEIVLYKILGEHAYTFRVAPLITYLILLALLNTVIWKRFGKNVTFLMITFCSILPYSIRYNMEARMYSMAFLFVFIAYYGLYLVFNSVEDKKGYVLLIIGSLGAAYSHYYAMITVAFFYLALLVQVIVKRLSLITLIKVYAATIIGYLPWLFQMISTFKSTSESFWATDYPTLATCLGAFYRLTPIYAWFMLAFTISVVILNIIIDVVTYRKSQSYESILKPETIWQIWGVICGVGMVTIGELICIIIRPAFSDRYIFPAMGPMWLALCVGITNIDLSVLIKSENIKLKIGKILTLVKNVVFIFIFAITLYGSYRLYQYSYGLNRASVAKFEDTYARMNELIKPEDVLVSDFYHYSWTLFDYYFPSNAYIYINGAMPELNTNEKYWFVSFGPLGEQTTDMLENSGYKVQSVIEDGELGTYNTYVYEMIYE